VPSEAVMPFAGFLWFQGEMSPLWIILFSTLGSFLGSIISYFIGLKGGRPFIEKFGKYFLLNLHHLELTEKFFAKFGNKAIFISRFIPVVRHLISIPAGMGEMNFKKFILFTVIGAAIWNSILTVAGFYLGSRWAEIKEYSVYLDYLIAGILIGLVIYWVYRRIKK
jgi:membrane protein DedA with SNARE-associated domain